MDKTIRIVTYTTIAAVFILPIIMLFISGWEGTQFLLYYVLGWASLTFVIGILRKFLSKQWVYIIMVAALIVFLHFLIQSWIFTSIMSILAIIFFVVYFKLHHIGLTYIVIVLAITLWVYIISFDGFHVVPEVSDSAMQHAEDELVAHDDITQAGVRLENDRIYCRVYVDSSASESERKQLGDTCAVTVSQSVASDQDIKGPDEKGYGPLYDDYELWVIVNEEDNAGVYLMGIMDIPSDEVMWQRTDY